MKKKMYAIVCLTVLLAVLIVDGIITVKNFSKPTGSIKILDSKNNLIYEKIQNFEGYQTNIRVEDLPEYIKYAVISAEDANYFNHIGVSPLGILRALITNIKARRLVSGGSTITQQVSRRNLAFNRGLLNNKFIRKLREINSAIFLEITSSKNEILNNYISTIYLGNNSYGLEAAAYTYFGKSARELSLSEAALLAGTIRSPVSGNPKDDSDNGWARRNEVLKLMYKNKYITDEELVEYSEFPVGLNLTERVSQYLHFVDYALKEAAGELGLDKEEDLQGMSIYTTLNPVISSKAQKTARDHVLYLSEDHKLSNSAVVVLQSEDAAILAMIGSIDYFNEDIDGAVNVATSYRQPGSALKPITYAQAFYRGVLTPESIIMDEKTTFIDKKGESFVPYNYNGVFNGPVTARIALASSLNLPAVKVLEMIGVDDMLSTAQKLGLKSLNDPDRYDLSITLGGGEITLLELTNVYASFSRGGKYKDVYSVTRIEDENREVLFEHKNYDSMPVWNENSYEIASTIYSILSDKSAKVLGFGRNNVLTLPYEAASKTGTTTDWHDNWTFGYTMDTGSDYSVGVWVGNSDNSPMYDIDGVTGAGPIWREVMLKANEVLVSNLNREDNSQIDQKAFPGLQPQQPSQLDTSDQNSIGEDNKAVDVQPTDTLINNQITNPPPNSEYIMLPSQSKFERILIEVTVSKEVFSVEYLIDGTSLGIFYEKDDFEYLWNPIEGSHTVEAYFKDSSGSIISKDSSDFVVRAPQS